MVAVVLALYLFALVSLASWVLIGIFPETVVQMPAAAALATGDETPRAALMPAVHLRFNQVKLGSWTVVPPLSADQGLLVLALLAGVLGSFLHAAQSLAAYVGNRELRPSWILWYALRPLIGGVLGLLFYFVVRAGLISASTDSVSPYGVVAFGALAGWFSKQATDKLAEVFETMFRSARGHDYKDKLFGRMRRPRIAQADPPVLKAALGALRERLVQLTGDHFSAGVMVTVNGDPVHTRLIEEHRLEIRIPVELVTDHTAELQLIATNPTPHDAPPGTLPLRSDPFRLPVLRGTEA